MHKGGLEDVAYCPALQRAATCGERTVRVIDVLTWKEIKSDGITLDRERGMIEMLEWTKDGQILTLSTSSGVVRNYLAQMPTVHDAWGKFFLFFFFPFSNYISIINITSSFFFHPLFFQDHVWLICPLYVKLAL